MDNCAAEMMPNDPVEHSAFWPSVLTGLAVAGAWAWRVFMGARADLRSDKRGEITNEGWHSLVKAQDEHIAGLQRELAAVQSGLRTAQERIMALEHELAETVRQAVESQREVIALRSQLDDVLRREL